MKSRKVTYFVSFVLVSIFLGCEPESKRNNEEQQENLETPGARYTDENLNYSIGQKVYVPTYDQVYSLFTDRKEDKINANVVLSIRNTDMTNKIFVKSVTYFDSDGKLIEELAKKSFEIDPMASVSMKISKSEKKAGVGASFIIIWNSIEPVFEPYIETVMMVNSSNQGYAWNVKGTVLKELTQ